MSARSAIFPGRRFLAPEVIQTSAMDCGPASLKCLLEGFGIHASYGRLREACQTEVDGTSIDQLETAARALGLDAEETMIPLDHLLHPEARALPALVVTRLPNGLIHFVVVWRRHGPLVQVMDPAAGRRWLSAERLLQEVFLHELRVEANVFGDWSESDEFSRPLERRLRGLGFGRAAAASIQASRQAGGWLHLAALDAAARLAESLCRAGGVKRGRSALRLVESLHSAALGPSSSNGGGLAIPETFWTARPVPGEPGSVILRGCVALRARGRLAGQPEAGAAPAAPPPLTTELAAALKEPPPRPGRALFKLLAGAGFLPLTVLAAGLCFAACAAILEAVLLRGALEAGRELVLVTQRLESAGFFLVFLLAVLVLELRIGKSFLSLGRQLEARFRIAFLEKIPRLLDRYFQSRPVSDMAERGHSIHRLRDMPRHAGQFLRAALALLFTAAAIAWIDPQSATLAYAAAAAALLLPLLFQPALQERDLKLRTHRGALNRFFLDALLGLMPARAHGAARAIRREQESLLVDWARASRQLLAASLALEGVQGLVGFGLAALILVLYAGRAADPTAALLLAYWALYLPQAGEEIAFLARQLPTHRNLALRLLEPLGAPEEPPAAAPAGTPPLEERPTAITGRTIVFDKVSLLAGGHPILQELELSIPAGSHVAIVGPSGAGKSSLAGLLLGWHLPSSGEVRVDDCPLDGAALDRLRLETAWVDPAAQLWNRSLLDNLRYGAPEHEAPHLPQILEAAEVYGFLDRLPEGLQTPLGEGGRLLSGGEGQRVRLGRGMLRRNAQLVILDEPCRGLDRIKRKELLDRARRLWQKATLLCITHDVAETIDFERVLVLEGGRVIEDGSPLHLAKKSGSRFRALLEAEEETRARLWTGGGWRRLRLEGGRLVEDVLGGKS